MAGLDGLADAARSKLDPVHWDYIAGGAGDERTLRENEQAFDLWRLRPRVLRPVGSRDLRTTLLGTTLDTPVLVAPTAFHLLAHPGGEAETAAGVAAAGSLMVAGMAATQPVEKIAAAGAPLWFQLYLQPDRGFTETVVRRAEAAGCRALVVTVDSPVFGRRPRDLANGFLDLPAGMACENMRDEDGRVRDIAMDADLDWDRVDRLREATELPVLLKGVLHPADAHLAVEHGIDGLVVSNHGGRQLDRVTATLDALPAVVDAVGGAVPVLLDGGIRRGTDVLVALALGASAVLVGRPVLWGLAVEGATGVRRVLTTLADELEHAMALTGAARPAELTPDLVVAAEPTGRGTPRQPGEEREGR
ncbi:alpha-hydroxy-acid oxidizing protein [Phycicoccus sp. CSK15P-2]|uniref:alpha-hydroxy acid oxidase n=1 Tax=Phycicoccus sp. CSK15P-2 TaxID=2807627 RepID=UPI00195299DD|nr:alpha-hydroxy acid oxidase [Phycicoccus sp. CSK15P-2]MBM6404552.1 alpha-hydroxy-acid oxidizing protein [Phycicoccus sp. CSK15P-2]